MKPKHGEVVNGCLWLDGESYLIHKPSLSLIGNMTLLYDETEIYIDRLKKRQEKLKKFIEENT